MLLFGPGAFHNILTLMHQGGTILSSQGHCLDARSPAVFTMCREVTP